MAMLQRRFASSIDAVRRSLERMKEKRGKILADPEAYRQEQIDRRLTAQAEALKDAVSDLLRLVDGQGRQASALGSLASAPRNTGAKRGFAKAQKPAAAGHGHGHATVTIRSRQPEPAFATAGGRSEIPMEGDFKDTWIQTFRTPEPGLVRSPAFLFLDGQLRKAS